MINLKEGYFPQELIVPAGTTLNNGLHEDSEHYIADQDTPVLVVGPWNTGAYPIRIIENGEVSAEPLYLHSPNPETGTT